MKGIVCKVCGYIVINGIAPEKCPVCGAPRTAFQEKPNIIKTAQDEANLSEKHTPVITVVKKCGLIPDGCQDVHTKVGQVQHPMLKEHYIMLIDFYLDNNFLARVHLSPEKLNPAAALHLKAVSGKISVIEHCNIHGAWIAETNL
ncbi:MAG: desulfoferrodoxin family protein [Candidatus Omnitrophota bacterium]